MTAAKEVTKEVSKEEGHKKYRPTDRELWGIYWLNELEYSQADISKKLDINASTIHSVIKRIEETGSPLRRDPPGAPLKLDERSKRHLKREKRENPDASYTDLKKSLETMGQDVSEQTVSNTFKRMAEEEKQKPRKKTTSSAIKA